MIKHIFAGAAVALLSLSALAQSGEKMSGAQLDGLVRGNTVYFELLPGPAGTGLAPYYFGADGKAALKLPNGTTMRGPWRIDGDKYCTDWDNGPKNSCSELLRGGDKITSVNPADGKPRSTVTRVVPGNAEKL